MTISILPQTAFLFMLLFSRLGSMVMLLPAFGDVSVPVRIRLLLAVALTFVMLPLAQGFYGQAPSAMAEILPLLFGEIAIGIMIGGAARLLMSALQFAGAAMSFQMGLSYAQSFDPTQGIQGAILGSFLSVLAVTLILVGDLHHLFLAAISDSYILFRPGALPPLSDFAELATNIVANSFKVGIQVASPFLAFGLIFYLGIGILSRLMPQVQIFFVAMPANILLGLTLMMLLLSAMLMWFLDYFRDAMQSFLV